MAEIQKIRTVVDVKVSLTINEDELKALDALFGYDFEAFLKTFYSQMGRSYLEPHEAGLRSLSAALRNCGSLAKDAEECREFLSLQISRKLREVQAK